MAAYDDSLRLTTEIDYVQSEVENFGLLSLGSLSSLRNRVSTLLERAIDRNDERKVQLLLDLMQQLDTLAVLQEAQKENREVGDESWGNESEKEEDDIPEGVQGFAFFQSSPALSPLQSPQETPKPKPPVEEGPLDCPICYYENVPDDEIRALSKCGHRYCHTCLETHFKTLIEEGKVNSEDFKCPDPNCSETPEVFELQNLLTREVFDKYLQFLALSDIKNDSNLRWCPNKACGQPILWDPEIQKVDCPACHTTFCFLCKQPWHEGSNCPIVLTKEDKEFVKYIKGQGKGTKPCPKCGFAIEKNSGCNHMTCVNCQHQWCWLCCGDYSYDHFSSGPCSGLQFTEADSLNTAKIKKVARYVGIGAGVVVAAPLVVAGGAILLAGGLIALPIYGVKKMLD